MRVPEGAWIKPPWTRDSYSLSNLWGHRKAHSFCISWDWGYCDGSDMLPEAAFRIKGFYGVVRFNPKYGLLGSNMATDETLKLFPKDGEKLVYEIQEMLKEKTNKNIEVMVYGDGAFKDPVGKIWELADPVVSPFYTKGLEGTPNELKLKYLADNKYNSLNGEKLNKALEEEIKNKNKNLVGKNVSLGTTPRRYTDLLGSLADLTSGSGDKGTPVVLIQHYFDNYSD